MSLPPLNPPGGAGGPLYSESAWDTGYVDGNQLPGRVRVRGELMLKKDQKNASGVHGSRPTYHGIETRPVEIVVECWTDEQRNELDRICKIILPKRETVTTVTKKVEVPAGFVGPLAANQVQIGAGPTLAAPVVTKTASTVEPKQKPVTIRHPSIASLGCINQMVVEGGTGHEQTGQRGWTRMVIRGQHWLAPLKGATSTAKGPTRNVANVRSAALTNPTPESQAASFAPPAGPRANG